jgi:hypothetical protein
LSHAFARQGVHFVCLNAGYGADEEAALGPEELCFLEEDLAFSSIAQDELGHAAALYAIVAGDGDPVDDDLRIDELAFRPSPGDWRSAQLVEVASGDWVEVVEVRGVHLVVRPVQEAPRAGVVE